MPNQETRLAVFQELAACCHNLYMWTYDTDMRLLSSNFPYDVSVDSLLVPSAQWASILNRVQQTKKPLVVTDKVGLTWIAAGSFDEKNLLRIHLLGPFFLYDVSSAQIEDELRRRKTPADLISPALTFFRKLPILYITRALEYEVMLHFCLTGEKLSLDAFQPIEDQQSAALSKEELEGIHGTYEAEREMVRLVREGDLHFKQHMQVLASTGRVGNISDGHALRQMKNMIIVNITLFSRAAMEGGLPPETAYTLSDRYLQAVEKSRSVQAIADINTAMQDDYVQRVHQVRQNEQYSKAIRNCLDQMHFRMEEDITLEQLAHDLGYSPYYLSRKFRNETGQTFKEYLRQIRLERAKFLLQTTNETILSIAERLRFCSQSYFSDTFRKTYGLSPTEYRDTLNP